MSEQPKPFLNYPATSRPAAQPKENSPLWKSASAVAPARPKPFAKKTPPITRPQPVKIRYL